MSPEPVSKTERHSFRGSCFSWQPTEQKQKPRSPQPGLLRAFGKILSHSLDRDRRSTQQSEAPLRPQQSATTVALHPLCTSPLDCSRAPPSSASAQHARFTASIHSSLFTPALLKHSLNNSRIFPHQVTGFESLVPALPKCAAETARWSRVLRSQGVHDDPEPATG